MYARKLIVTVFLVTAASLATPAKAAADWLFTPFIGVNWGASVNVRGLDGEFDDEFENRVDFGASLAWMGGGIAGFEVDFGYSPNFFRPSNGEEVDFGDSNLVTLMGNVVFGIPIGGQHGAGIRPYVLGGFGLVRSSVDNIGDVFDVSSSNWGFDVGGGVNGFFSDNVGIRGDVRYFRALQDIETDDLLNLRLASLRFWRGSVGVTFRF